MRMSGTSHGIAPMLVGTYDKQVLRLCGWRAHLASLLRIERLDPFAINLAYNMTPDLERGCHLSVLRPEGFVSDDESANPFAAKDAVPARSTASLTIV